jgi:hypothetical protein
MLQGMNSRRRKRVTIHFEPGIHGALRLKAAATQRSVSDLVNEAVRAGLVEDAADLAAFEKRASEPSFSFEGVIRGLRRRDKV